MEDISVKHGLREGYGVVVQDVLKDAPAETSGLRAGDLIVAIDGQPVSSAEDVVRAITQRLLPGQRVELTIVRGKARKSVTVVLGERPATPPRLNR